MVTRAQLYTFDDMRYFLFWVVWLQVRFVPLFGVVSVTLWVHFIAPCLWIWFVWAQSTTLHCFNLSCSFNFLSSSTAFFWQFSIMVSVTTYKLNVPRDSCMSSNNVGQSYCKTEFVKARICFLGFLHIICIFYSGHVGMRKGRSPTIWFKLFVNLHSNAPVNEHEAGIFSIVINNQNDI